MATYRKRTMSVTGLGYVGLPVAVAFAKAYRTIGYDVNEHRIQELTVGHDRNGETTRAELKTADIFFTSDSKDLMAADFHIIAADADRILGHAGMAV